MPFALFQPKTSETHPNQQGEEILKQVSFTVYKFNNRPKPVNKQRILIIGCFSEFGCETVGVMYCIPKIIKKFPGMYVIAAGWNGRAYFYKHLVDEFWELGEEYMSLRNRTFAFHNKSTNIDAIEKTFKEFGFFVPTSMMGRFAVGNTCKTCGFFWNEWKMVAKKCPKCDSTVVVTSMFADPEEYKKTAIRIPRPKFDKLQWAKDLVGENAVGVFARDRATYGRNLTPEFYASLIQNLENLGYKPIWLGEKQSTLPCPVSHILDFSANRDLEDTLSIVCNCKFTIQFWTASSRLAGMMGVPFILFESPEQIYCSGYSPGQEGKRLDLMTFGPKKIVISHFINSQNDNTKLLLYVNQAIEELNAGNYNDLISELVEDVEATNKLKTEHEKMIRG